MRYDKQKVGELLNRPIIIGDRNLKTVNEIIISDGPIDINSEEYNINMVYGEIDAALPGLADDYLAHPSNSTFKKVNDDVAKALMSNKDIVYMHEPINSLDTLAYDERIQVSLFSYPLCSERFGGSLGVYAYQGYSINKYRRIPNISIESDNVVYGLCFGCKAYDVEGNYISPFYEREVFIYFFSEEDYINTLNNPSIKHMDSDIETSINAWQGPGLYFYTILYINA